MTLDLNAVVRYCDCGCTPKWMGTLCADLDAVTTGAFRVQTIGLTAATIGLTAATIERVETWARKKLKSQADTIVKQELEREAIKPTPFKIKERREQLLATLHWTTYNNTPVRVAGQPTR